MLADPRVLKRSTEDQMWLRLVDVKAALSGRRYSEEGSLVFDVKDESCPWNQGRLGLNGGPDGADCKASDASPDLGLRSSTLSTAYLGAVPMTTLARAGLVEEHTAGALARADRMFSTTVPPWWPISI
jgi:predicted acetyltransferase